MTLERKLKLHSGPIMQEDTDRKKNMKVLKYKYFSKEESQEKKTSHKKIAGAVAAGTGVGALTGHGIGKYIKKKLRENVSITDSGDFVAAGMPDDFIFERDKYPKSEEYLKALEKDELGNKWINKYKAPLIGGAVLGAGLGYGGYKLYKHHKNKKRKDKNE